MPPTPQKSEPVTDRSKIRDASRVKLDRPQTAVSPPVKEEIGKPEMTKRQRYQKESRSSKLEDISHPAKPHVTHSSGDNKELKKDKHAEDKKVERIDGSSHFALASDATVRSTGPATSEQKAAQLQPSKLTKKQKHDGQDVSVSLHSDKSVEVRSICLNSSDDRKMVDVKLSDTSPSHQVSSERTTEAESGYTQAELEFRPSAKNEEKSLASCRRADEQTLAGTTDSLSADDKVYGDERPTRYDSEVHQANENLTVHSAAEVHDSGHNDTQLDLIVCSTDTFAPSLSTSEPVMSTPRVTGDQHLSLHNSETSQLLEQPADATFTSSEAGTA